MESNAAAAPGACDRSTLLCLCDRSGHQVLLLLRSVVIIPAALLLLEVALLLLPVGLPLLLDAMHASLKRQAGVLPPRLSSSGLRLLLAWLMRAWHAMCLLGWSEEFKA